MASNNDGQLKLAGDAFSAGHITKDEYAKIAHQNGAISDDEFAKVTAPGWKTGLSKVGGFAAETGGLMGGEILGAAGGAMTSPVTGPVGPIVGRMMGGGAGEALGEVGRKELDTALGFRKQPTGSEIWDTLKGGAKRGAAYSAIGQAAGPVIKKMLPAGFGKGWAKMASMATGGEAGVVENVAKSPGDLLPERFGGAKSMEKAKAGYTAARDVITGGKELGVAEGEVGGIYEDSMSKSKAMVNDLDKALKRGEQIVAKEAVPAYEWVNSRLRQLVPDGKSVGELTADARGEYFGLKALKGKLQGEIRRDAPEFFGKIVDYAKSSTKDKALNILPQGYGARYLARRAVPIAAGFMNPMTGLAIGAGMSPAVWSGLTAAGVSGYAEPQAVKAIDMLRQYRKKREDSRP